MCVYSYLEMCVTDLVALVVVSQASQISVAIVHVAEALLRLTTRAPLATPAILLHTHTHTHTDTHTHTQIQ